MIRTSIYAVFLLLPHCNGSITHWKETATIHYYHLMSVAWSTLWSSKSHILVSSEEAFHFITHHAWAHVQITRLTHLSSSFRSYTSQKQAASCSHCLQVSGALVWTSLALIRREDDAPFCRVRCVMRRFGRPAVYGDQLLNTELTLVVANSPERRWYDLPRLNGNPDCMLVRTVYAPLPSPLSTWVQQPSIRRGPIKNQSYALICPWTASSKIHKIPQRKRGWSGLLKNHQVKTLLIIFEVTPLSSVSTGHYITN